MKTENNKLIAKFMNYANNRPLTEGLLKTMYNDWNSLMEVVDKIESLNFTFAIKLKWVKISKTYKSDEVILVRWEEDNTKIEAVYNACVAFIEWYNVNK
jgi:hypothetical protein